MGEKASLGPDPATDYYHHKMWIRTKQEKRQLQVKDKNQFPAEMDHMAECVLEGK